MPGKHLGRPLPFKLTDGKADLGNPKAKVQVTVYIPASEGCGNDTAFFLYDVAKANPKTLSVTVIDFKSNAGQKHQNMAGLSCAGIVINGKQQFKVTDASGNQRMLNFHSNLGDTYQTDDVYLALDLAYQKAYGTKVKRAAAKPAAQQPPASAGVRKQAWGETETKAK